jgi:hypothetical protein
MVKPPASKIAAPTAVEPVKLIMSTCGDVTSASPTSGFEPTMQFTTPGGNPTSSTTCISSMIARGSCGAGFITTVLPVASAGPILPAMFTSGKLYGEMHATTPTGGRLTTAPTSPPGASGVGGATWGGNGIDRSVVASWA